MPFSSLLIIQYILDVLSMLDQYVRAHVAFRNERGIEVTHPVQTALHYMKTSFALDLLSWFPGDLIVLTMLDSPLSMQQWHLIALLRINRLIQFNKVGI